MVAWTGVEQDRLRDPAGTCARFRDGIIFDPVGGNAPEMDSNGLLYAEHVACGSAEPPQFNHTLSLIAEFLSLRVAAMVYLPRDPFCKVLSIQV